FNRFGLTWQVIVQAESPYRQQAESLAQLRIRNRRGAMVPVGSLASLREANGPLVLTRYNMHPAASINGTAAPGVSSGDAIKMLQRLAQSELPQSMGYEWTDMSYLELLAGNTAMIIFAFAVVMVFLVLAAQYESWSLPLAVILVVPMCLLSAITGVNIADQDINIFTQIGFVVLVGLVGVTLFGIVLTPVFFFTIDWLGESRMFASRFARHFGSYALDVLALRGARKMAVHYIRATSSLARKNGDKETGRKPDKEKQ